MRGMEFFGRFFDIFRNFLRIKEARYSSKNAFKVKTIIEYRWSGQRFSKRSGTRKYISTIGGYNKTILSKRSAGGGVFVLFPSCITITKETHIFYKPMWHTLFKYKHFLDFGVLIPKTKQSPNFKTFKEPKIRFHVIKSDRICTCSMVT